jgi:hypothetical protein
MKALFIKWVVTLGALTIAIICVFFAQVRAVTGDWLSGQSAGLPSLQDSDLGSIQAVKFLPPGESVVKVGVSELHVLAHGPGYATIGMTLTSNEATSLYPSLRIYLKAGQRLVRTLVVPPTRYEHQASLLSEQVSVTVTLQPGETGFTASAFYGAGGG